MRQNFPLLIQKLLLSESVLTRMEIARTILNHLQSKIESFGEIELVMRRQFISRIKVCALNPCAIQRNVVIQMANFYSKHYKGIFQDLPSAA